MTKTVDQLLDEARARLAAATLQDMGFRNATDVAGGFQAWKATGLPVG